MRKKVVARIGFGLRLLAVATAAIGCAVFAAYQYAPEQIDALDLRLERWLTGVPRERLQRALAELPDDPAAGLAALERLEAEFRGHRPGEHGYQIWQRAALILADRAQQSGDRDRALALAKAMVEANPRDFPARLRRCRWLLAAAETAAEGRLELVELQALVPEQPDVTRLFVQTFADDPLASARALARHLRRGKTPFWVLRYDGSDSLIPVLDTAILQPRYATDGMFRASFRLPAGTRGAHIDLPPGRYWTVREARLLRGEAATDEVPLSGAPGMRPDGDLLFSDGGRCALDFAFSLPTTGSEEFVFECRLQQGVAPWLLAPLRGRALLAGLEQLRSQPDGAPDAALLRRWRGIAAMQQPASVFAASGGPRFSANRRLDVPVRLSLPGSHGVSFSVESSLPDDVDWARFDPPLIAGSRIRIDEVAFLDAQGQLLVALTPASWSMRNHLDPAEAEGRGVLAVTGNDPWFAMRLPAGAASLVVRGVLP